jgi:hypothetical protein
MKKLAPEQEAAIAEAIKGAPKVNLDLSEGDEDESGGGAIANACSVAREAMETCAGCVQAGLTTLAKLFGAHQNS